MSIEENDYSLWAVEQIYVILSRVKMLKNVYFVGPKDQTLKAIQSVLKRRGENDEYISFFCLI